MLDVLFSLDRLDIDKPSGVQNHVHSRWEPQLILDRLDIDPDIMRLSMMSHFPSCEPNTR